MRMIQLQMNIWHKVNFIREKDVESRIAQLRFLEQYLDENNIIRIYSPKDGPQNNSLIECDYIIESQLPGSLIIVYIFLKYRAGIGSPCAIISFGVKKCGIWWTKFILDVER